jgi:hypothetical protein
LRRSEARGGAHRRMADCSAARAKSRAGQRPPVVGGGQEVGVWGELVWPGKSRENGGKGGGAVAAATVLNGAQRWGTAGGVAPRGG